MTRTTRPMAPAALPAGLPGQPDGTPMSAHPSAHPSATTLPLPILPAPDPVDPEYAPLLSEAMARGLPGTPDVASASSSRPTGALRDRLFGRVAASRAASGAMSTSRLGRLAATTLAPGVRSRSLYEAPTDRPLRPGEPLRARLLELQPGSCWAPGPDRRQQRDWLVLRGQVDIGSDTLRPRDYHVAPAGHASAPVSTRDGAWLFLRESADPADPGERRTTTRDQDAGWPEYAPGIRRRVLWRRGAQAAMLYHTQPGAMVPHHVHGHDEECLMVEGDLFLDDILLRPGDYQLAPAGTGHRVTATDTGVVIYAHGDLDLQFVG